MDQAQLGGGEGGRVVAVVNMGTIWVWELWQKESHRTVLTMPEKHSTPAHPGWPDRLRCWMLVPPTRSPCSLQPALWLWYSAPPCPVSPLGGHSGLRLVAQGRVNALSGLGYTSPPLPQHCMWGWRQEPGWGRYSMLEVGEIAFCLS